MIMILFLCLILFITILFFKKQTTGKNSNPGSITFPSPPRLPLIGNLHQLGQHPHRSLCYLSHRYGPLMVLHFGSVPVIIASTAEAARDILKTHDAVLSSRPRSKIFEKLLYKSRNMASAPYGEYWRQMKSVSVIHLLSNKMVRSYREVRQEEISLMMEKIRESGSSPMNLSKILSSLTNDVICRVALGRKYGVGTDFKELIDRLMRQLGTFTVGSYVPWLGWIDWVSGLEARLEKTANDFDKLLERIVQDHEDGDGNRMDFVDVLLAVQREKSVGFEIDRFSIKAIILDAFVGGTDTSSTLVEWEMTELLGHPECLKILQEEVRTICKGKSSVSEDDVKDMHYLKAVIKETLRLHPPVPLMVPHQSIKDVRLRGNYVPAGTQVIVNLWAVGREAATWGPDPNEFRPERHLEGDADFRGQDFELIPFGAGRRMCPGISFAVVLNEVVLANLVHGFDWQSTEDQTDVAESIGSVIRRMHPLYVTASSTA
ncbi:PREDICTED: cytochrome P450 71A23 [Camelina sativa]|uniref:Cytochrome P450 71A23 n=1 Tax=Camelina sativa TaxID=90675 RepID=A0ABM0TH20_CAMSA|nr:PREDICTED: cytochrome P450 71A23 [Camelina sativa]